MFGSDTLEIAIGVLCPAPNSAYMRRLRSLKQANGSWCPIVTCLTTLEDCCRYDRLHRDSGGGVYRGTPGV
jgi:hypothetical protein